jgi:hypothetical protein
MPQRTCFAVFLLGAAGLAPLYGAKPGGGCQDLSTQWTLNEKYVDGITDNGIRADALGSYSNGQAGVTATIKICEQTYDAVLMAGSSRQLTFDFGQNLSKNSNTPSWATGPVMGTGGVLNIRNITYVPPQSDRTQEYAFTTWMGSNVPVRGTWNFRMWNPTTDAVAGDPTNPYVAAANSPDTDAPVNAYHCPVSVNNPSPSLMCAGVTLETWFVWPLGSGPWVGGLMNTQKSAPVNGGQFSMPFYFVISVL